MEGRSAWGMFVMYLKRQRHGGPILISKGLFLRQLAIIPKEVSVHFCLLTKCGLIVQAEANGHKALATTCYCTDEQQSSSSGK